VRYYCRSGGFLCCSASTLGVATCLSWGPLSRPGRCCFRPRGCFPEFGEFHVAGQLLQVGHSSRSVYKQRLGLMLPEMTRNRPNCRAQAVSEKASRILGYLWWVLPQVRRCLGPDEGPRCHQGPGIPGLPPRGRDTHRSEVRRVRKRAGAGPPPDESPERIRVVSQFAAQQMPRPVSRYVAAGDANVGFRPHNGSDVPTSDQIARCQRSSGKCRLLVVASCMPLDHNNVSV
jgi:hypothetical protein